jgi:hypothetical protein
MPESTSDKGAKNLAYSLAREAEKRPVSTPPDGLDLAGPLDADLARVVNAWLNLPEPIRRAILAIPDLPTRHLAAVLALVASAAPPAP